MIGYLKNLKKETITQPNKFMKEENWVNKFDERFKIISPPRKGHFGQKWDIVPMPETIKDFIRQLLIEEYRKGYNRCLRDFKIPNEFGETSL